MDRMHCRNILKTRSRMNSDDRCPRFTSGYRQVFWLTASYMRLPGLPVAYCMYIRIQRRTRTGFSPVSLFRMTSRHRLLIPPASFLDIPYHRNAKTQMIKAVIIIYRME